MYAFILECAKLFSVTNNPHILVALQNKRLFFIHTAYSEWIDRRALPNVLAQRLRVIALPLLVSFPDPFGRGSRAWETAHWLIEFHVSAHIVFAHLTLAKLTSRA